MATEIQGGQADSPADLGAGKEGATRAPPGRGGGCGGRAAEEWRAHR
jgi:hypothetical protein